MQAATAPHDAELLDAYRTFTALDDAVAHMVEHPANDDRVKRAGLDALWPPRLAALEQVTATAAGSPEALRAKAEVLRRILAAEGCESRAEELALSLVEDILRQG